MAKIVYGVAGEGSGHSSRAREMASHLSSQGHELWLASYDRGYRNLKDDFQVFEIEGLCIASEDNKVSVVKTFTENLKRLPEGHRRLQDLRHELFKRVSAGLRDHRLRADDGLLGQTLRHSVDLARQSASHALHGLRRSAAPGTGEPRHQEHHPSDGPKPRRVAGHDVFLWRDEKRTHLSVSADTATRGSCI